MTDETTTPCQHPAAKQRSLYIRGPRTRRSPYLLDAHRCTACGALLDNVHPPKPSTEPGSVLEPAPQPPAAA